MEEGTRKKEPSFAKAAAGEGNRQTWIREITEVRGRKGNRKPFGSVTSK